MALLVKDSASGNTIEDLMKIKKCKIFHKSAK